MFGKIDLRGKVNDLRDSTDLDDKFVDASKNALLSKGDDNSYFGSFKHKMKGVRNAAGEFAEDVQE